MRSQSRPQRLLDRRSWPSCQAVKAAQSKKLIIAIR
jgi:hypothetical protein